MPPFGTHPEAVRPPGHCFPAGHASGGFALLALGWLSDRRAWRIAGTGTGLAAGSVMAAYQMAKGAHFLSHSLATLALGAADYWLHEDLARALAKGRLSRLEDYLTLRISGPGIVIFYLGQQAHQQASS